MKKRSRHAVDKIGSCFKGIDQFQKYDDVVVRGLHCVAECEVV